MNMDKVEQMSVQELRELEAKVGREALEALGLWEQVSAAIQGAIREKQANAARAAVLEAASAIREVTAPAGSKLVVTWMDDGTTEVRFTPAGEESKSGNDRSGRHVVYQGKIYQDPIDLIAKQHESWFKNKDAFAKSERYTDAVADSLRKYGATTFLKRHSDLDGLIWMDKAAAEDAIRSGAVKIGSGFKKLDAKMKLDAAMNKQS